MLQTRSKTYEITLIALLAACNSVLELTLGNYLHIIKFPLTGIVMVGVNIIIYTAGYSLVPKKGTVISMGILTAMMNLFFGGSFKLWSIVAIFLEAVIIEIIFDLLGMNIWSVISASISANVFSLFFTFFIYIVVLGRGIIPTFMKIVGNFTNSPDILNISLFTLGGFLILLHVVAGTVFGLTAWRLNPVGIINARRMAVNSAVEQTNN